MLTTNISKLPRTAAYYVFVNGTIYHEGDERSREHPGHGYPAYTEEILKVHCFETVEQLERWVLQNPTEKYTVVYGSPVKVETQLKVTISN